MVEEIESEKKYQGIETMKEEGPAERGRIIIFMERSLIEKLQQHPKMFQIQENYQHDWYMCFVHEGKLTFQCKCCSYPMTNEEQYAIQQLQRRCQEFSSIANKKFETEPLQGEKALGTKLETENKVSADNQGGTSRLPSFINPNSNRILAAFTLQPFELTICLNEALVHNKTNVDFCRSTTLNQNSSWNLTVVSEDYVKFQCCPTMLSQDELRAIEEIQHLTAMHTILLNKEATGHIHETTSAAKSEGGRTSDEDSTSFIMQYVQTSERVYHIKNQVNSSIILDRWLNHGIFEKQTESQEYQNHKQQEVDKGDKKDNKKIKEGHFRNRLMRVWRSLSCSRIESCQTFWSHEWIKHGKQHADYFDKMSYLELGCDLHDKYDMAKFLNEIVMRLGRRNVKTERMDDILWYGVPAKVLKKELKKGIASTPRLNCCTYKGKWLLYEVGIAIKIDKITKAVKTVSYKSVAEKWKANAIGDTDLIWFAL